MRPSFPRGLHRGLRLLQAAVASLLAFWLLLVTTLVWLATRPDALQRSLDWLGEVAGVSIEATGARGSLIGPFTIDRLVVHHDRASVTVDALAAQLRPGALLHGTVGIAGLSARRVSVVLHESRPATDPGFLPAWLRIVWDRLAIDRLEVGDAAGPLVVRKLSSSGSLTRWTLRAERLEFAQGEWSARGRLRLQAGQPAKLEWGGTVEGPVLANGPPWLASGTLRGSLGATIDEPWRFAATTSRPRGLTARGELRLLPEAWRVAGEVEANRLDLTPWGVAAVGRLSGQVSGRVSGQLSGQAGVPRHDAVAAELTGRLTSTALPQAAPRAVGFKVRGEIGAERWQAADLRLDLARFGQLVLRGEGSFAASTGAARLAGRWHLPAAGAIDVEAEAESLGARLPHWRLSLRGRAVDWRRLPLAAATSGSPFPGPARVDLTLAARGAGFSPPSGRGGRWTVERFVAESGQSRLSVQLDWRETAAWQASFHSRQVGEWWPGYTGILEVEAEGSNFDRAGGDFLLKARATKLRGTAISQGLDTGTAVLRGHWTPAKTRGELAELALELGGVPSSLRTVRQRAPASWQWQGGQASWQGFCLTPPTGDPSPWTACTDGSASATRVQLQGTVAAPRNLTVRWRAAAQGTGGWRDWPLEGSLEATLPAIDFLPAVFPDIDRAAGKLSAALTLGGTASLPDYRGTLALADGELDFVPANLRLRKASATLAVAPGQLQLTAQAETGEGRLAVDGDLRFDGSLGPDSALRGEMHLRGERLLLADVPEARLLASPDLRLILSPAGLRAEGIVRVPEARLAPPDLTGVVLPSPDERMAGTATTRSTALPITASIQLQLGDRVQLATLGLSGQLQGNLLATLPVTGATTARGELSLTGGKFKAYTRELDIERGRLLFTGGPLSDPGLDLRAARQFPGVKAGVLVRGTLRRPLVRFFSDPARPQGEVASLLLVGRSLEGLQGSGGLRAGLGGGATAARDSVLQQGGALVAAQLGQYVGLDEVQLERDANDAASLVFGKYLSPRLYVSYGVGLTEALNTLKLRYTLGRRWVIRTEAGTRQSIDLEYSTTR